MSLTIFRRVLPLVFLFGTVASAAQLDLSKTGIKANITVPAGTTLENASEGRWYLSDPGDFSLDIVLGDQDLMRGVAEMKGTPDDIYTFKRYVTNKPDFFVVEGTFYKKPTYVFNMKMKVAGKTFFCGNDLNASYSRALADKQIAACKTIKAK